MLLYYTQYMYRVPVLCIDLSKKVVVPLEA
jgi:hypothetical protein